MKKHLPFIVATVCGIAGSGLYYFSFTQWIPALYFLSALLLAIAAGAIAARFAENKPLVKGLIAAAGFGAGFFALNYLVNNVIFSATKAKIAAGIVCAATLLFFVCFYCACAKGKPQRKGLAALAFGLAVIAALGSAMPTVLNTFYKDHYEKVASPVAGSEKEATEPMLIKDADFYVSPAGSDENDGSLARPFQTVAAARDAVRHMDKTGKTGVTVALMAGEYRVTSLTFGPEDGGTKDCPVTYRAYGDGEAVICGGITLPHESFVPAQGTALYDRLPDDAKTHVLAVDLFALGITEAQYGKIYAVGNYNTASKYDGDWVGDTWCELFIDDARQTIARYPNGREYRYTGEVVKEGQGRESASASVKGGYDALRNPEPDVYKMDKALSERIAGWKSTDGVWMFGYWRYDWADGSTPLGTVDLENLTMSPMFVSSYGAKKGAPYYFFNVPEELDAPGEWYLDRKNGVLYFYPPESFTDVSAVELSLTTENVIRVEADCLTFDGLTVKGTRGDAVSITGTGNTVKNCLIKNAAGNALLISGYDNTAENNEITRTGKGGVVLSGGDRDTLTPGNNRAQNNLVHDWSEIYETYQPAFSLNGVGNVCSHNEMYNSPHEAITYAGNDHLIEYNLIHDVNLLTDDGGAIYSGRRWDWYGTVIRYNLIYDLGKDGHRPVGIYMDDALAGQTIYGNIIVNAPNLGIQLGGGRDLIVHDNIVVNSYAPLSFDARALSGLSGDESSSFYQHYKENGSVWQLLFDSPWQSEIWQKAYPQYAHYSDDFSDTANPDFVLNPAYGSVTHNLFVSEKGWIGDVADEVYQYSDIKDNALFRLSALQKLFVDPENGDYTLRDDAPIDFEIDVPAMSEFGRR